MGGRRMAVAGIGVGGSVRVCLTGPRGRRVIAGHNIATNYALQGYAQWAMGVPNGPFATGAVVAPQYIAVGTWGGTCSTTDLFLFGEVARSRQAAQYSNLYQGTTAQLTASWPPGAITGTILEAGLFDAPIEGANVGTGGVAAGATTLPVANGPPAVTGGSTPGRYETIWIDDGASSEYCALAASADDLATSWTLQTALQYGHAAGVVIQVFGPNLWAHASIDATVDATDQMSIQWSIPFTATGQ